MVLVSHSHKFIFLKTRKTAGTSVEMALEHVCAVKGHVVVEKTKSIISKYGIIGSRNLQNEMPPQPCLEKGIWFNHKPAEEVRDDLGTDRFDRYLKITTVRNPFDRCVSAFHWFQRQQALQAPDFTELKKQFLEYVKAGKWIADRRCVFIDRKFVIDRAIRFEHLVDDLTLLTRDYGIPVNINAIPHTKSTSDSRRNYAIADYYDPESIEIVRKRQRWVFRYFDYAEQP